MYKLRKGTVKTKKGVASYVAERWDKGDHSIRATVGNRTVERNRLGGRKEIKTTKTGKIGGKPYSTVKEAYAPMERYRGKKQGPFPKRKSTSIHEGDTTYNKGTEAHIYPVGRPWDRTYKDVSRKDRRAGCTGCTSHDIDKMPRSKPTPKPTPKPKSKPTLKRKK